MMVQSIDKVSENQEITSLDTELSQVLSTMPESLKVEILHYAGYLLSRQLQSNSESTNQTVIPQAAIPQKKRQAGLLKGKIWMADDFDEPLEEMKDYM